MDRLKNVAEEVDVKDLDAVIRLHHGLMYRCIMRVLSKFAEYNTAANADDIFQNLCLAFKEKRKLERYDPVRGSKLGTFIGLLATHAAYDFLRVEKRKVLLYENDGVDEFDPLDVMADDEKSPEEVAADRELIGFLLKAREELPPHLQAALDYDLAPVQESPEESAAARGIGAKTVYSQRHKMKRAVVEILKEHYGDEFADLKAA